jgi:hypothetical protein
MPVGRKRTFREKWRLTSISNKVIAVATVVIAGASVLQFGTTFFQWTEMHDAGKQTDRIIAADERLAGAMEGSVKESGSALQATIDNFHLDQRAWLGPTEMLQPGFLDGTKRVYLREGEPAQFGVGISNTGKTPARNVIQQTSYISIPSNIGFRPRYPGSRQHVGVIHPNAKIWATTPWTGPLLKPQITDATRGAVRLYFFGTITYDDVWEKTHHTTFCFYLVNDLSGFTNCDTYNTAD